MLENIGQRACPTVHVVEIGMESYVCFAAN
jgi:hypothetical protein